MAFDATVGQDAEAASSREIERLHAKIGQLMVESDFFAKRFGADQCWAFAWRRARRTREPGSIARVASRRSAGNARRSVSRSGVSRKPRPAKDDDLETMMRRVDARFAERPFFGAADRPRHGAFVDAWPR
ncbi:MAG: hypothetical protein ABR878_15495 [Roseiarcus sp.]